MAAVPPWIAQATTPTPTPAPEVGPDELGAIYPLLIRVAWFLGGLLVFAALGWFVVAPAASRLVARRNPNNRTIREAIRRYVGLVFVVLGILAGAAMAGFQGSVQNGALIVAAGTLALGVAGQTVIGSIVSGLALVSDPEFNVGDYISWADGEGTVRSITLRVTRVQTPEGELVTVPNETLTSQAVTRPYGWRRHRISLSVTVGYGDDLEAVLGLLEEVARDLPRTQAEPEPRALVTELRADVVECSVHFWIEDTARRDVREARSAFAIAATDRFENTDLRLGPLRTLELSGQVALAEADGSASLDPDAADPDDGSNEEGSQPV